MAEAGAGRPAPAPLDGSEARSAAGIANRLWMSGVPSAARETYPTSWNGRAMEPIAKTGERPVGDRLGTARDTARGSRRTRPRGPG